MPGDRRKPRRLLGAVGKRNMSPELLLDKLQGVKAAGLGRWRANCPAHEGSSSSLSIMTVDDGRILIHCFAGCEAGDVVAALGMELSDLFPPRESSGEGYPEVRRRFDMEQAILALRDEAYFLQASQYWLAANRKFTPKYQQKLEEAGGRINAICAALGIVQDNKAMGRLLNKWLAESVDAGALE